MEGQAAAHGDRQGCSSVAQPPCAHILLAVQRLFSCFPCSMGWVSASPGGFCFSIHTGQCHNCKGWFQSILVGARPFCLGKGTGQTQQAQDVQGTSSSQTHEEQTPCKHCPRWWPCAQEQPALCVPASSALVSPPGGLLAALHHPALIQSRELGQIGGHQASTTSLCHATLGWGQTALQRTSAPSSVVLQGRFPPHCVHNFSCKLHSADARSHLPGAASVLEDAGWPHATSSTSSTRPQHLHRAWALAVCDTRDGQTATPI